LCQWRWRGSIYRVCVHDGTFVRGNVFVNDEMVSLLLRGMVSKSPAELWHIMERKLEFELKLLYGFWDAGHLKLDRVPKIIRPRLQ
jgi:hypothetical protein